MTIGERPNKKNIESLDLAQKVHLFSKGFDVENNKSIKSHLI